MDDDIVTHFAVSCSSMVVLGKEEIGWLWLGGDDATSHMVKKEL